MKMHVLSGGWLRMRKSIYASSADRSELIDLPVSCYLLKHPQGNVLFDTGCHPSVSEDAEARWGNMAKVMKPVGDPAVNLLTELAAVGVQTADIDVVINSHFHSDHCGCNEYFDKATVICHCDELATAEADGAEQQGFLQVDWKHNQPIQTIDSQYDVFGDGRIVLVPLPGHTPGLTGALVNLDQDGSFLLTSDAVAMREHLEQDVNPRNTWDAELASKSMAEIRRIQAAGSTVLFGHDAEQWSSLRKGVQAYE